VLVQMRGGKRRLIVQCGDCGKELERFPSEAKYKKNFFCNCSCKGAWQSVNCRGKNSPNSGPNPNLQGENNPNYGNRWTEEQKKHLSEITKERMKDPRARYAAGTANRGKKFSEERIRRMHSGRSSDSYSRSHTEETRKLIGEKSAAKWTSEYKEAHRETMIKLGHWVSEEDKLDYAVYFEEADWIRRMWDYCSVEGLSKLREKGIWHYKTNLDGLVRDHAFSRRSGFECGVFPEILRHPANLNLITHRDNVSKARSGGRDSDSISLNALFSRITEENWDWEEQDLCVHLVFHYEAGYRWCR
jgi:hypothetical protein